MTDAAPASTEPRESEQPSHRKRARHRRAITSIAISVFVTWLGSTMFLTSHGVVAQHFQVSDTAITLALSAYPIALILVCVAGGRLSDILGRKSAFLWAGIAFTIVGLITPLARNVGELLVARALTGAAAGVILAATGGVLVTTMHGRTRHNAWLWWRGSSMAGIVLGPVLGPLIAATLAWRWVAPLSSILVVIALILGATSMDNSRDEDATFSFMMVLPAFLLGLGLLAPYLLLVFLHDSIDRSYLWGLILFMGIASIIGYVILNSRLANPVFDEDISEHNPRLWLTDAFSALHICGLFIALAAYAIVLGDGAGLTSVQTALAMLLMAVPTIGFHLSAHHVRNARGITRQWQTGIGVMLLALAVACFYAFNRSSITLWTMTPTLILAGSGFGMLRLFGHMGVIKVTGTRWAGTLFGTRVFGNHTGAAIGALIVGVTLAASTAPAVRQDPALVQQAALAANIAIVCVIIVVGIFLILKRQMLGFDDVHWHPGEPDIVVERSRQGLQGF